MNKPIIVIMLALSSMFVSCNRFPYGDDDPKPKKEAEPPFECTTTALITGVFDYSYTGAPMLDGCGSVFTHSDGKIYIPEDEAQIPDSIKNRQTFAPAKYLVTYMLVGGNPSWQCGISPEKKSVDIIRVLRVEDASYTICKDYPVYNK